MVTGAGSAEANGVYQYLGEQSDNAPVYQNKVPKESADRMHTTNKKPKEKKKQARKETQTFSIFLLLTSK